MPNAQLNNFNMNSQLNLTKKSSQPNATTAHTKQNTFTYGHQSSQHSNVDPLAVNKTNSRNGPRGGESFNNNAQQPGPEFHGDTGHDYNIQN